LANYIEERKELSRQKSENVRENQTISQEAQEKKADLILHQYKEKCNNTKE